MPKKDIDYSKTVMYKIVCLDLSITDAYIGHTTDFIVRKNCHKSCCTNENNKSYNIYVYQFLRNNGGWNNFQMIEIEKYPCNDSNEAGARERYWYEQLNSTLNTSIPNRDPIEYSKYYYEKNVEQIKAKRSAKVNNTCECGTICTNIIRHKKTLKHCAFLKK